MGWYYVLFQTIILKVHLTYILHIKDVTGIKLIRRNTLFDLNLKAIMMPVFFSNHDNILHTMESCVHRNSVEILAPKEK